MNAHSSVSEDCPRAAPDKEASTEALFFVYLQFTQSDNYPSIGYRGERKELPMHHRHVWQRKPFQVLLLIILAFLAILVAYHMRSAFPPRRGTAFTEGVILLLILGGVMSLTLIVRILRKGALNPEWLLIPLALLSGLSLLFYKTSAVHYTIFGHACMVVSLIVFIVSSVMLAIETHDSLKDYDRF